MQIPKEKLNQLKLLYKEAFEEELTDEEAQIQGLAILRFIAAKQDYACSRQKERTQNGSIAV